MTLDQINNAYVGATSYPDIIRSLISLGVASYTAEAATDVTVFRLAGGITVVRYSNSESRVPTRDLDAAEVKNAILANQQGRSDFKGFMDQIARAGVRFYEATLIGDNRRVEYFGIGDSHVEAISI
ncbi:MAG: DUF1398 family protein [Acidobacteria bacterium]|nr:DUF1398 family protein [Acidobacteriota bacterium]